MVSRYWAYRCGEAGVSIERTNALLSEFSFCWRSVYKDLRPTGKRELIPNVAEIRVGDSLLIYYKSHSLHLLGSYLIVAPREKVGNEPRVSAVGIASDASLVNAMEREPPYPRDPYLDEFTGFFLRKDDYAVPLPEPPTFIKNALVRIAH
jgi:hypothetical protein